MRGILSAAPTRRIPGRAAHQQPPPAEGAQLFLADALAVEAEHGGDYLSWRTGWNGIRECCVASKSYYDTSEDGGSLEGALIMLLAVVELAV